MKVLLVHENNPDEVQVGGAERYLVDIAAELTKIGHDVHLFALSGHRHHHKHIQVNRAIDGPAIPKAEKYISKNRFIFHISNTNRLIYHFRRIIFYFDMHNELRRLIKRIKPDVIHLHNNYEYLITILIALRGQKVIQTVHDYVIIYPTAMCIRKNSCAGQSVIKALHHGCVSYKKLAATGWLRYNRRFIDRCFVSQFIAPSKDLALRLAKRGYGNVIYLPNFSSLTSIKKTDEISTSSIIKSRSKFLTPTLKKLRVVLYVGQLVTHKGVDILLRAYALIESQVKDIALWIVGDGPAENDLKVLSEELGLYKIVFFGRLNHSDLSTIYNQVHVVVIPSLWFENAPLVAYEAMAHSRAILATRIGGLPELVTDAKNGYLFERGNSTELAQHMRKILTDDALAQSLGKGSREKLAAMDTLSDHVQRLVQIYAGKPFPSTG